MKKRLQALALLSICLLISGCQSPPSAAEKPYIPVADVPLDSSVSVRLFYISEQDGGYSPLMSEISIPKDSTLEKAAIVNLMQPPESGYLPVSGAGWRLNSVDVVRSYSQNVDQYIAFIDITVPSANDYAMIPTFRSACAETLLQLNRVDYVMVTVDGVLPQGLDGILSTSTGEGTATEVPMLLYYPDAEGKYAIPLVRMVAQDDNTGKEKQVFNELKKSTESNVLGRLYPSNIICTGMDGLGAEAEGQDEGEVIVYLEGPRSYLDLDPELHNLWNRCFALSLLANTESSGIITICFTADSGYNNDSISKKWTYSIKYVKEDPTEHRKDDSIDSLTSIRGAFVQLYLADRETTSLMRMQRICSFEEASNPYTCVSEILKGPLPNETKSMLRVAPDGVSEEDFLGCWIDRDTVVVNFSRRFYDKCAGLGEHQELLLTYAITNALTDNYAIKYVQFVREGASVEDMAGRIILSRPLLRNPGIIR